VKELGNGAVENSDSSCPKIGLRKFRSNAMSKTKMILLQAWCVLTLGMLTFQSNEVSGAVIESGFSYQGRLYEQGVPAGGVYQMQFVLVDSETGGTPLANALTNNAVLVTNGIFQVKLNFGQGVWNGDKRWLEIGVRTNAAVNFSIMSPRQPIVPVPYDNYASRAAELTGNLPTNQLGGTYGQNVTFSNPLNQFSGSGAGLTSLNAGQLSFGTVPDARLSSAIARINDLIATNNALINLLNANNTALLTALTVQSNNLAAQLDASNTNSSVGIGSVSNALSDRLTLRCFSMLRLPATLYRLRSRAKLRRALRSGVRFWAGTIRLPAAISSRERFN